MTASPIHHPALAHSPIGTPPRPGAPPLPGGQLPAAPQLPAGHPGPPAAAGSPFYGSPMRPHPDFDYAAAAAYSPHTGK